MAGFFHFHNGLSGLEVLDREKRGRGTQPNDCSPLKPSKACALKFGGDVCGSFNALSERGLDLSAGDGGGGKHGVTPSWLAPFSLRTHNTLSIIDCQIFDYILYILSLNLIKYYWYCN